MKKFLIRGVLFSSFISLLVACNPKKEEPATVVIDKEQIKKEIQAKEDEFAATYNAGVAKDIGYYADDAMSFFQNRAPLVGKKEIVDYLISGLNSENKSNKISFSTKEVFPSNDGEQVVELGYYTVTDSTNTVINTGNYMVLFVKRDGKYVSFRDMSASDMPVQ